VPIARQAADWVSPITHHPGAFVYGPGLHSKGSLLRKNSTTADSLSSAPGKSDVSCVRWATSWIMPNRFIIDKIDKTQACSLTNLWPSQLNAAAAQRKIRQRWLGRNSRAALQALQKRTKLIFAKARLAQKRFQKRALEVSAVHRNNDRSARIGMAKRHVTASLSLKLKACPFQSADRLLRAHARKPHQHELKPRCRSAR